MDVTIEKEAAVGWRVRVFWEGDGAWFEGVVAAYSATSGYYVKYDDGEEQWEAEDPAGLQFIAPPPKNATAASSPPASPTGYEDDDYEHDEDEGDGDGDDVSGSGGGVEAERVRSAPAASPKPEEDADDNDDDAGAQSASSLGHGATPRGARSAAPSTVPSSKPPARALTARPRDPVKLAASGVFLRDPETLREMKTQLLREKKALEAEHEQLLTQQREREAASTGLKRELQELKTQVTLAGIKATATAHKANGTARGSVDWAEHAHRLKATNRQTRRELAAMQSALQDKTAHVARLRQQREQLQGRLERIPRKDLRGLVDVQMEIAQLLNEKRAVEGQLAASLHSMVQDPSRKQRSGIGAQEPKPSNPAINPKAALEKELRALDQTVRKLQDGAEQWKLSYEREQAKVVPVQARLQALQTELFKYQSSQVLLRSVFLRLDRQGTGSIPLERALEAFVLLAPSPKRPREELATELEQGLQLRKDEELNLAAFVRCFNHLFRQ